MFIDGAAASGIFTRCIFKLNTAGYGGVVHIYKGSSTFTTCSFIDNEATNMGGGVYISSDGSGTFISCSWSGNTVTNHANSEDLYIWSTATSATIINSESTMDILDPGSKIVACSGNSPCTASIGNTCTAAAYSFGGVVCRLPACPAIVEGSSWNEWSASCRMSTTHTVASGDTVKIKKSAAMVEELIIDRGATSGNNRHFFVQGSLEMEDVTLTGGYTTVSSFCSLYSLRLFVPIV